MGNPHNQSVQAAGSANNSVRLFSVRSINLYASFEKQPIPYLDGNENTGNNTPLALSMGHTDYVLLADDIVAVEEK